MPKQYEEIRDSYVKRGKSLKEAKRLAAMTYNARHPGHPMKPHRKKSRHEVRDFLASKKNKYY